MMDQERINALGDELYEALRGKYALIPLTDREPEFTSRTIDKTK